MTDQDAIFVSAGGKLTTLQPWCQGLDFDRGAYVAALPEGEETVLKDLEKARSKVEQVRLVLCSYRPSPNNVDIGAKLTRGVDAIPISTTRTSRKNPRSPIRYRPATQG